MCDYFMLIFMSDISFIPVLLGSDANVYGMARSFHEAYDINSIAVSKTVFTPTVNSSIIDFTFEPDLENHEKFLAKLIEVSNKNKGKKLVLVPCSDGYVSLVGRFKDELKKYYLFNCPNMDIQERLSLKESFYATCDQYGFDYPKTEIVTAADYKTKNISIQFPVIIKASNSVEYWKCSFVGKRKVFVAQDKSEYDRILNAIYSSEYKDVMTIQEFIPGDDSFMRVLNCYVGQDGRVKLMALGHALLEDHTPQGIGNYAAIMSVYDKTLMEKFKFLLEDIGYTGFANFDMKYDARDGKYKFFETNLRQGRSSFFVTASGYNLAKWLVDDIVYNKDMPLTIAQSKHLWVQVPKGIVYKYVKDEKLKKEVKQLIKQGKCTNSLFYSKDMNIKRYIKLKLNMVNHYRKYKKFYGKKGMSE